jgi:hypothetical protein
MFKIGFICLFIIITCVNNQIESKEYSLEKLDQNVFFSKKMNKKIQPYLLPENHPAKAILDVIFVHGDVLQDESSFSNAGFITKTFAQGSLIHLAIHPALPEYIFKIYLNNQTLSKGEKLGWKRLVNRCKGAENVRKLIQEKKLKHITVPDKWLYIDPTNKLTNQPILLIETNMNLASNAESDAAWKQASKEVIDELYCILSHGYASSYIGPNIPYTSNGTFACIDTEYPKRKIKYDYVRKFLSADMCAYWDSLIKTK